MTSPSKQTELTSLLFTIIEGMERNTAAILLALDTIPSKTLERTLFSPSLCKQSERVKETPAITEPVSDQLALKIVGESYYKWNSVSSFYPPVVFIFREKNVTNRRRKSQIKARLSVRTKDLTDEMIRRLRERAEALAGPTYNHGVVRGNYVSSDKRFKTTVYRQTNPQIVELFSL